MRTNLHGELCVNASLGTTSSPLISSFMIRERSVPSHPVPSLNLFSCLLTLRLRRGRLALAIAVAFLNLAARSHGIQLSCHPILIENSIGYVALCYCCAPPERAASNTASSCSIRPPSSARPLTPPPSLRLTSALPTAAPTPARPQVPRVRVLRRRRALARLSLRQPRPAPTMRTLRAARRVRVPAAGARRRSRASSSPNSPLYAASLT